MFIRRDHTGRHILKNHPFEGIIGGVIVNGTRRDWQRGDERMDQLGTTLHETQDGPDEPGQDTRHFRDEIIAIRSKARQDIRALHNADELDDMQRDAVRLLIAGRSRELTGKENKRVTAIEAAYDAIDAIRVQARADIKALKAERAEAAAARKAAKAKS